MNSPSDASPKDSLVTLEGTSLTLPGIASAHSHAFQRALRARTQRSNKTGSFWSWRGLMYEHAAALTPSSIYESSKQAYEELVAHGVTAVGEFHYVHHNPDGTPYEDRTVLADAVIRAARDVGMRISLLRVIYERGGYGQQLDPVQRRFVDADVGDALDDVESLRARYADDNFVRIGIAPHSVRATSAAWIQQAHAFSAKHALPFHMHVAEQEREIEECVREYGKRPVELLGDLGALDARFVAVHATHLLPHEATLLGKADAFACICRTTERDLGDGLPNIAALRDAGARFCVGTDSHAISCPFEEARAVELDERSRTRTRHAGLDAKALLRAMTVDGYASIGFSRCGEDRIEVDADDIALRGFDPHMPEEALIYAASRATIASVSVGGNTILSQS